MRFLILLLTVPMIGLAFETRSSVSLGTGGAGVASLEAGEASFTNPASIMHLKGRQFFSTVQSDLFALSLIENDRSSALPGAFSYAKRKETEAFGFSLADFAFRNFAIGATLNYFQLTPKNKDFIQQKRATTFNGTLGVSWNFSRQFGVGASFDNISDIPQEFATLSGVSPRTRLGLNYIYKDWFRLRFDAVTTKNNRFSELTPQGGFESYFGQWVIGRVGWSQIPGFDDSWSAGLGLSLPKFKIDYATAWISDETSEIRHSIDLGLAF